MPQVSQIPLKKEIENRLVRMFHRSFVKLEKDRDVEKFFLDFLSSTEKKMLAKRLGIALMLYQGTPYRQICETLRVTPSTVFKIKNQLERGAQGLYSVIEKLARDRIVISLLKELMNIYSELWSLRRGMKKIAGV